MIDFLERLAYARKLEQSSWPLAFLAAIFPIIEPALRGLAKFTRISRP